MYFLFALILVVAVLLNPFSFHPLGLLSFSQSPLSASEVSLGGRATGYRLRVDDVLHA